VSRIARVAAFAAVAAHIAILVAVLVFGAAAFDFAMRAYLRAHPEVVVEALDLYEQRAEANAERRWREVLTAREREVRFDPRAPVLGNPAGDATIVEFFDYKCPYCRQLHPQLAPLLTVEPNVRLVLKQLPLLGPESTLAARASLAAWQRAPGRFPAFHDALMRFSGRLDEATALRLAAEAGIDAGDLMLDMADPRIDRAVAETHALALALGIQGTPGIIIGDAIVPGYIDSAEIRRLIAEARRGCATCRAPARTD
jgi:protein-disulfide isomerase